MRFFPPFSLLSPFLSSGRKRDQWEDTKISKQKTENHLGLGRRVLTGSKDDAGDTVGSVRGESILMTRVWSGWDFVNEILPSPQLQEEDELEMVAHSRLFSYKFSFSLNLWKERMPIYLNAALLAVQPFGSPECLDILNSLRPEGIEFSPIIIVWESHFCVSFRIRGIWRKGSKLPFGWARWICLMVEISLILSLWVGGGSREISISGWGKVMNKRPGPWG